MSKKFLPCLLLIFSSCPKEKTESFSTRRFENDPEYSNGGGGNAFRGVRGAGSRCQRDNDCYLPFCIGGAEAVEADEVALFTNAAGEPQGYCTAFCSKAACRPGSICVDPYYFQYKPSPLVAFISTFPPMCLKQCYSDYDCVKDSIEYDKSPPAGTTAHEFAIQNGLVTCEDDAGFADFSDPRCSVASRVSKCMAMVYPQGTYCVPLAWALGNHLGGDCDPNFPITPDPGTPPPYSGGVHDCAHNWCEPVTLNDGGISGHCGFPCTAAGCPQGSMCPVPLSDTHLIDNCRKSCTSTADCLAERPGLTDFDCLPLDPDAGPGSPQVCDIIP